MWTWKIEKVSEIMHKTVGFAGRFCSVLIYERVGPSLTRMALLKAGEIEESGAVSARGEKLHFHWRQKNHG